RVRLVDRVLEGTAAGLNATGGLVVEADGRRETVVAGEVEEVRPA
ncbi:MAG: biotin--[acetyl-CoA-carboxylase] ligase, partial [Planctomycetota bacterium]|nr:biotin--[acetyl-CoA-carboxylase] ligase [Planctomycetota bacterium]